MTVFADPSRCPDCRTVLGVAPHQCPRCSLPLTGPVVEQLFATLTQADGLLATLRASKVVAPRPSQHAPAAPVPHFPAAYQSAPSQPAAYQPSPQVAPATRPAPRPLLGLGTVPRILLGLGALFLLVGALTFLAMTWSLLGTGGRTAVLLLLTVGAAGAAYGLSRAGLRIASEALTAVAFGLGVLDLTGARAAGWFGDLSVPHAFTLVGGALTLVALLVAALGTLGDRRPLVVPQVLVPVGALVAGAGLRASFDAWSTTGAVLPVVLCLVLAPVARTVGLRVVADVLAGLGVCWWVVLLSQSAARMLATAPDSYAELVRSDASWALLATAALVAVLPFATSAARTLLPAALGVAATLVVTLVVWPSVDEEPYVPVLVACGVVVAGAAAVALVPSRRWLVLPLLPALAATPVAAGAGAYLGALGLGAVGSLGLLDTSPLASLPDMEPAVPATVLVAVLVSLAALATAVEAQFRRVDRLADRALVVGTPAVVGTVLLLQPPLLAPVVLLLLAAGTGYALWLGTRRALPLAVGATTHVVALVVSLPSDVLVTTVLALATAAAALAWSRAGQAADLAPALVAFSATAALWSLVRTTGTDLHWAGLVVLLLVAPLAAFRRRYAVVLPVVVASVVSGLASVPLAPQPTAWLSLLLFVGAVVTSAAGLRRPVLPLPLAASAVLATLSLWTMLLDRSVDTLEAYTLPLAAGLLGLGVWWLGRTPEASSWTTVFPGLLAGVLPSFALTLGSTEAPGFREGMLALVCVGLVLLGAQLRLAAPFVVGAVVGAVVVLQLVAPYAYLVPTFVWLVGAGVVLTVCGITWEARLNQARAATSYVTGLR